MKVDVPPVHPQNGQLWMPDFYREAGFYFTDIDSLDVNILEPPSSTFPKIPKPILDRIADTVRVVRNDEGKLVEVARVDPVDQTFYFAEAVGEVDAEELEVCRKSLFMTIHTNSYFFKPSIEEIALQVPPELWGVTSFVQCDRAHNNRRDLSWPPHPLVDPESGRAIYTDRLHLANTTMFLKPAPESLTT